MPGLFFVFGGGGWGRMCVGSWTPNLDDAHAHAVCMLRGGTVVPRPHVALERRLERQERDKWQKKRANNTSSLFDVAQGSFMGAELCELVGLFFVRQVEKYLWFRKSWVVQGRWSSCTA